MTMGNETYVMVEDDGSTTLEDAAASQGSRRTQRGNMPGGAMQGAPDRSGMPQRSAMPQRSGEAGDAQTEAAAQSEADIIEKAKTWGMAQYEALMAWLYEGVETNAAQQPTGSLVKVTTGIQSDDYAEITSGLSEGDIVLYTADEESSSSMFGGMMGGGMRMGGMRMGF